MKTLTVDLPGRAYEIQIERGLLDQVGEHCRAVLPKAERLAVVTDSTVGPLYGQRVLDSLTQAGFQACLITVPAGEPSKSLAVLERVYDALTGFGLTRTDAVAALGGGVVGDLAGFAAATLFRGVDFVQIPTTLLAQVDSSVGGKVAIDLKAGKNLAGAFWQPRLVLMDPAVLDTLPEQIFLEGMAEVVKYGCIFDRTFFDFLEARPNRAALMAEMEHILYTCCDLKRGVVVEDERDTGNRMLLNFGHTLGHAYELAGNYTRWSHGAAVAAGMCTAARLGVSLGVTPADLPERIEALCAALALPIRIPCTQADYAAAIGLDKKGVGHRISLILLEGLGHGIPYPMEKDQVLAALDALLEVL
ncbi:MAG: 3-dehydroquinate synthase [Oscillospiraceae bacterium]|nr:3-dehydroquinate synthase [Oscillospiraceae bacterium]